MLHLFAEVNHHAHQLNIMTLLQQVLASIVQLQIVVDAETQILHILTINLLNIYLLQL